MTEYEIAAALSHEAQRRGVQPIVNLVATDERIFMLRHPLPTGKTMQHYAMVVLCGRRHGLVISLTRLVHFGKLSSELTRKNDAVAKIDAAFIAATRPGVTLGEVFAKGVAAYAATGYPEEWRFTTRADPRLMSRVNTWDCRDQRMWSPLDRRMPGIPPSPEPRAKIPSW